jgi:tetratricopeptide (TPR) repeat protein
MREKAQAVAEQALEGEPTALVHYNLSRGRGSFDTATRLADLDNALRVDPKYGPALMDRANLHLFEKRFEDALADTAELLQLPNVAPEVYVLRANIFDRMGRREDALAQAAAVVVAHPDMAWAHVAASRIYNRLAMREEALAAIDRAIEMAPNGGFYLDRSQVRERTDWDARLADIDEQLVRMPNDMSALFTKAELLTERGDHAEAARVYSLVLETQAESPEVLHSRGLALWRSGRREEAEADLAAAHALAGDASVFNNFCYMKAVANVAVERALEECEESLRLRPDFAPTLDSRGAVLLRLGRLDEAIRDFDRVLEQAPGMTNSIYLRAVARSQKGDAAGALADLEIVRRDNPELIEYMERNGFVVAPASAVVAAD